MNRSDESAAPYTCTSVTPWGPLTAEFSDIGLVKASFTDKETGARCIQAESGMDEPNRADPTHTSVWSERLSGAVRRFLADGAVTLPLDLTPFRPWTRADYVAVLGIPPGRTTTYGSLAAATGRSGSARAVGAALSHQPFAFFLPTHRVLPARGGLGRCTSGAGHLRLELLRREGIV